MHHNFGQLIPLRMDKNGWKKRISSVLCFNAFISVHICLSFFIVFLPIFGE